MRFQASLVVVALLCSCSPPAGNGADGTEPGGLSLAPGLEGWKFYLEEPDAKLEDVWSFDGEVLICKGTPKGYLYTQEDHTNFVLELQWRWPAGKEPGKGGVLVRMSGEHKIWPKSLEAQINAGGAGDFWGLDGYRLSGPAERSKTLEHEQFGSLINVATTDPAEKPAGEWNSYKITAKDGTVTLEINGKVVNEATDCDVTPGKICLTSEGDEIHFRGLRLR